MRNSTGVLATLVGLWLMGAVYASGHEVEVLDDCDPTDARWEDIGGCTLRKGDVDLDEFNALLSSPLAHPDKTHKEGLIGHPAWRNRPQYLKIEEGDTVKVKNNGGRPHTFTEVKDFGGGRIPVLNFDLKPAPECLRPAEDLAPGDRIKIKGLREGAHLFMCCIHPWMRAVIKVEKD